MNDYINNIGQKKFYVDYSTYDIKSQIKFTKKFLNKNRLIQNLIKNEYSNEAIIENFNIQNHDIERIREGIKRLKYLLFQRNTMRYEEEFHDIIDLLDKGFSQKKIDEKTGVSLKTINKISQHMKIVKELKQFENINVSNFNDIFS